MIRLVCFDLDGTLADTIEDLKNAVNHALMENGLKPHSIEEYRHLVGNGVDNLMKSAIGSDCDDELFFKVKSGFERYYTAHHTDCTKAYEGMDEVLKTLSENGIKTAVLSNKPDRFVPAILKKLYPQHIFSLSYGQRAQVPRKPAPDALDLALSELGVEKNEAVYIGDSDVDVVFSHAAGVRVFGAAWGFRGEEELKTAGADEIAKTPKDLIKLLF